MAKEQEGPKLRFFKLGDNAAVFYDPSSGLKVANKQVVSIEANKIRAKNEMVTKGLANKHIVEVKAEDFKAAPKELRKALESNHPTEASLKEKRNSKPSKEHVSESDDDDDDEE